MDGVAASQLDRPLRRRETNATAEIGGEHDRGAW